MTGLSLFDSVSLTVRRLSQEFTNPDDDWEPMVFFENEKEESLPIWPCGPMMDSVESKNLMANLLLPMMIDQLQASRIVFVMSVWVAELEKDEGPLEVAPSQHPNRKERVLLLEITAEGVTRNAFADIVRHENAPPTLGEWSDYEGVDAFDGRFIDPAVRAMRGVTIA